MKAFRNYANDHAWHDYGQLSYEDCDEEESREIRQGYYEYQDSCYRQEMEQEREELQYQMQRELEYADYYYGQQAQMEIEKQMQEQIELENYETI